MDTSDFNFIFLGQSVLKYQVPLDVYSTINHIYETKYPELKPANKQLVGKIEKEHSLFFNGKDSSKMTRHNHLPNNVLGWFELKFRHYLEWNKINGYNRSIMILSELSSKKTSFYNFFIKVGIMLYRMRINRLSIKWYYIFGFFI